MNAALAEAEVRTPARNGPPDNPLAMLSAALQSGTDPAKLEKLMDLADRWKAQQAAELYAEAMNAAQAEMPCVVRDAENTHTKKRYARLEAVNTIIRPVYTRHGFSLSFGTAKADTEGWVRIVCDVSHVGGCTRQYRLDLPPDGKGAQGGANMNAVQGIGSTFSYGRRYLTLNIFNVTVADEDMDAQAADALDTITEPEAIEVESQLEDAGVNRARFLEWASTAGHLIPGEKQVSNIRAKSLAAVLDAIQRKKAAGK